MIAKVLRGWRPGGLLAYLFGPGRFEEHRNPRVVASWDGAPWLHQPDKLTAVLLDGQRLEPGEFDVNLRPLTRTMQEPARLAGLPLSGPPALAGQWVQLLQAGGPLPADAPPWLRHYKYDRAAQAVVLRPGYVWHCPVRLHPDDPTLTDQQWQHIAQRLMGAVGIQQAGCRWIAVRHADDHIHLMAVLVSEDTGKRFHPYRDFPKLRAECQRLERELGLTPTASADRTAAPAPTRAELGKAERLSRPCTVRDQLRRVVSQCAATAGHADTFLDDLRREGLDPRLVRDTEGQVCGYTVAAPGDRTANGNTVRYSGRTLAPDLSWPKLLTRWANTPPTPVLPRADDRRAARAARHTALADTAAVVRDAAEQVAIRNEHDMDGVAHAAGEVLAVLSRGREGHNAGPLTNLQARYDRAARTPHRVLPARSGLVAAELRRAARQLGAVGMLTGRGQEGVATAALLLALASLVAEIAAWQQLRGRPHQATAARTTATELSALGQAVGIRRTAATAQLSELDRAGTVRQPSPSDVRPWHASMSPAARRPEPIAYPHPTPHRRSR